MPFVYGQVDVRVSPVEALKASQPPFVLAERTTPNGLNIIDPNAPASNVAACTWRVDEVEQMFANAHKYYSQIRGCAPASVLHSHSQNTEKVLARQKVSHGSR